MTLFFGQKKMKTKKIKEIKPSNIDASFQYICTSCGYSHWLFMREASAKNFFVVCDCGLNIRPKRIRKIKVEFCETQLEKPKKKNKPKEAKIEPVEKLKQAEPIKDINVDILNTASNDLMKLGFTKQESEKLLRESYKIIGSEDCVVLVKKAIDLVGVIDDKCN